MSPEREAILAKVEELVESLPEHEQIVYLFLMQHQGEDFTEVTTNIQYGSVPLVLDEVASHYEHLYELEGDDV